MRSILLLLLCLSFLSSCHDGPLDHQTLNGNYTGTFYRTQNEHSSEPVHVKIIFKGNTFTGSAQPSHVYPRICKGSYEIYGNNIEFTDSCYWTANFDWTLILTGRYELTREEGTVRMTKYFNDHFYDTYLIRLEEQSK